MSNFSFCHQMWLANISVGTICYITILHVNFVFSRTTGNSSEILEAQGTREVMVAAMRLWIE